MSWNIFTWETGPSTEAPPVAPKSSVSAAEDVSKSKRRLSRSLSANSEGKLIVKAENKDHKKFFNIITKTNRLKYLFRAWRTVYLDTVAKKNIKKIINWSGSAVKPKDSPKATAKTPERPRTDSLKEVMRKMNPSLNYSSVDEDSPASSVLDKSKKSSVTKKLSEDSEPDNNRSRLTSKSDDKPHRMLTKRPVRQDTDTLTSIDADAVTVDISRPDFSLDVSSTKMNTKPSSATLSSDESNVQSPNSSSTAAAASSRMRTMISFSGKATKGTTTVPTAGGNVVGSANTFSPLINRSATAGQAAVGASSANLASSSQASPSITKATPSSNTTNRDKSSEDDSDDKRTDPSQMTSNATGVAGTGASTAISSNKLNKANTSSSGSRVKSILDDDNPTSRGGSKKSFKSVDSVNSAATTATAATPDVAEVLGNIFSFGWVSPTKPATPSAPSGTPSFPTTITAAAAAAAPSTPSQRVPPKNMLVPIKSSTTASEEDSGVEPIRPISSKKTSSAGLSLDTKLNSDSSIKSPSASRSGKSSSTSPKKVPPLDLGQLLAREDSSIKNSIEEKLTPHAAASATDVGEALTSFFTFGLVTSPSKANLTSESTSATAAGVSDAAPSPAVKKKKSKKTEGATPVLGETTIENAGEPSDAPAKAKKSKSPSKKSGGDSVPVTSSSDATIAAEAASGSVTGNEVGDAFVSLFTLGLVSGNTTPAKSNPPTPTASVSAAPPPPPQSSPPLISPIAKRKKSISTSATNAAAGGELDSASALSTATPKKEKTAKKKNSTEDMTSPPASSSVSTASAAATPTSVDPFTSFFSGLVSPSKLPEVTSPSPAAAAASAAVAPPISTFSPIPDDKKPSKSRALSPEVVVNDPVAVADKTPMRKSKKSTTAATSGDVTPSTIQTSAAATSTAGGVNAVSGSVTPTTSTGTEVGDAMVSFFTFGLVSPVKSPELTAAPPPSASTAAAAATTTAAVPPSVGSPGVSGGARKKSIVPHTLLTSELSRPERIKSSKSHDRLEATDASGGQDAKTPKKASKLKLSGDVESEIQTKPRSVSEPVVVSTAAAAEPTTDAFSSFFSSFVSPTKPPTETPAAGVETADAFTSFFTLGLVSSPTKTNTAAAAPLTALPDASHHSPVSHEHRLNSLAVATGGETSEEHAFKYTQTRVVHRHDRSHRGSIAGRTGSSPAGGGVDQPTREHKHHHRSHSKSPSVESASNSNSEGRRSKSPVTFSSVDGDDKETFHDVSLEEDGDKDKHRKHHHSHHHHHKRSHRHDKSEDHDNTKSSSTGSNVQSEGAASSDAVDVGTAISSFFGFAASPTASPAAPTAAKPATTTSTSTAATADAKLELRHESSSKPPVFRDSDTDVETTFHPKESRTVASTASSDPPSTAPQVGDWRYNDLSSSLHGFFTLGLVSPEKPPHIETAVVLVPEANPEKLLAARRQSLIRRQSVLKNPGSGSAGATSANERHDVVPAPAPDVFHVPPVVIQSIIDSPTKNTTLEVGEFLTSPFKSAPSSLSTLLSADEASAAETPQTPSADLGSSLLNIFSFGLVSPTSPSAAAPAMAAPTKPDNIASHTPSKNKSALTAGSPSDESPITASELSLSGISGSSPSRRKSTVQFNDTELGPASSSTTPSPTNAPVMPPILKTSAFLEEPTNRRKSLTNASLRFADEVHSTTSTDKSSESVAMYPGNVVPSAPTRRVSMTGVNNAETSASVVSSGAQSSTVIAAPPAPARKKSVLASLWDSVEESPIDGSGSYSASKTDEKDQKLLVSKAEAPTRKHSVLASLWDSVEETSEPVEYVGKKSVAPESLRSNEVQNKPIAETPTRKKSVLATLWDAVEESPVSSSSLLSSTAAMTGQAATTITSLASQQPGVLPDVTEPTTTPARKKSVLSTLWGSVEEETHSGLTPSDSEFMKRGALDESMNDSMTLSMSGASLNVSTASASFNGGASFSRDYSNEKATAQKTERRGWEEDTEGDDLELSFHSIRDSVNRADSPVSRVSTATPFIESPFNASETPSDDSMESTLTNASNKSSSNNSKSKNRYFKVETMIRAKASGGSKDSLVYSSQSNSPLPHTAAAAATVRTSTTTVVMDRSSTAMIKKGVVSSSELPSRKVGRLSDYDFNQHHHHQHGSMIVASNDLQASVEKQHSPKSGLVYSAEQSQVMRHHWHLLCRRLAVRSKCESRSRRVMREARQHFQKKLYVYCFYKLLVYHRGFRGTFCTPAGYLKSVNHFRRTALMRGLDAINMNLTRMKHRRQSQTVSRMMLGSGSSARVQTAKTSSPTSVLTPLRSQKASSHSASDATPYLASSGVKTTDKKLPFLLDLPLDPAVQVLIESDFEDDFSSTVEKGEVHYRAQQLKRTFYRINQSLTVNQISREMLSIGLESHCRGLLRKAVKRLRVHAVMGVRRRRLYMQQSSRTSGDIPLRQSRLTSESDSRRALL